MSDHSSGMVVFSGNSHPALAAMVCERLGVRMGDLEVYNKTNRETNVNIKQDVRGKDVFIIQSAHHDVNNNVFELLILAYACRTSCARSVTVVVPYLPYSKQCRIVRRSSITLKLVAEMICAAGASRFVSLDLYKKEIQVIVTNTVPNEEQQKKCEKIKIVDISLLLCEAIRRIYHNESLSFLFRDVTIDD